MPSQKAGVAMPAIEKVRTTRSIQLFCFSAEIVPSGIAIDDRDDRRHHRDFERDREAGGDLHDRPACPTTSRCRNRSRSQTPDEIEELHDPRPVDADLGMAGGERLGDEAGAAAAQPHQADVAGDQPHQDEDQRRRPEQRRDHQQHAPQM